MNFVRTTFILENDGSTPGDTPPIDVRFMRSMSVIATTEDDTAAGDFTIEASNNTGTPDDPFEWIPIPDISASMTAGASVIIPTFGICYDAVRVAFAPSAGDGTVKVLVKCYEL